MYSTVRLLGAGLAALCYRAGTASQRQGYGVAHGINYYSCSGNMRNQSHDAQLGAADTLALRLMGSRLRFFRWADAAARDGLHDPCPGCFEGIAKGDHR